jgi:hypothetical protein
MPERRHLAQGVGDGGDVAQVLYLNPPPFSFSYYEAFLLSFPHIQFRQQ